MHLNLYHPKNLKQNCQKWPKIKKKWEKDQKLSKMPQNIPNFFSPKCLNNNFVTLMMQQLFFMLVPKTII